MMNILISVNRDYLDKAETMLHSLRRNDSEDVTVYLINHSLDSVDLNKFEKYLRKSLRMNIEIINVSDTFFDHIPMNIKRFSVEIYYRVLAQFLLPLNVERIMWLDADIVLCGSIREFYYQSFENNLIVACPDALWDDEEIVKIKDNLGLPKEHIYFNSGVLLLNIEELRKKTNLDEILKATQSIAEYFTYPDQDLLNFLYSDLDQQVIFDKQLVLFACLGLAGALLNHYPLADHLLAAGAGLLGFLLLSVVTRGSIGGGDIKLMGALGLWLGLKAIWQVAVGGILLGGIWALLLILCKKKGRKDFVPYSPGFILCGIIVYLLK